MTWGWSFFWVYCTFFRRIFINHGPSAVDHIHGISWDLSYHVAYYNDTCFLVVFSSASNSGLVAVVPQQPVLFSGAKLGYCNGTAHEPMFHIGSTWKTQGGIPRVPRRREELCVGTWIQPTSSRTRDCGIPSRCGNFFGEGSCGNIMRYNSWGYTLGLSGISVVLFLLKDDFLYFKWYHEFAKRSWFCILLLPMKD